MIEPVPAHIRTHSMLALMLREWVGEYVADELGLGEVERQDRRALVSEHISENW
jgi:hypothetical protein